MCDLLVDIRHERINQYFVAFGSILLAVIQYFTLMFQFLRKHLYYLLLLTHYWNVNIFNTLIKEIDICFMSYLWIYLKKFKKDSNQLCLMHNKDKPIWTDLLGMKNDKNFHLIMYFWVYLSYDFLYKKKLYKNKEAETGQRKRTNW